MKTVRTAVVRLVATNEIRQGLRSKAMRISFAVLVVIAAIASALPGLIGSHGATTYRVAVIGVKPPDITTKALRVRFSSPRDQAAGQAMVRSRQVTAAVGPTRVWSNKALDPNLEAVLDQVHAGQVLGERARLAAVTDKVAAELFAPIAPLIAIRLDADRNDANAQGLASAVLVLLFFALTAFGGAVLSGVMQEKTSRVVEVVLGSVRTDELLAGKILGIGLLAMGQVTVIAFVAGMAGKLFSARELPTTTVPTLVVMLGAFVFGYLFYASLFAAAGSLVSRVEDAQAAATPISITLTLAYVASIGLAIGAPDGLATRTLGIVPFTAPMVVIARTAAGHPHWWELVLAAAVMSASVFAVVRFAARVYRGSILRNGARVTWRDAWSGVQRSTVAATTRSSADAE